MELRHLRYFVTVAAERSFSRASEKLNIAQPPLSRQIQQLEAELGVQLLHRGRPLTLTESGRYFFEQARQVLQRTDAMRAMIRRIGTGKRRQFGIGFVESTLNEQLPELIRRFRLTAPDVEILLLDLTTLEQTSALKEGRIDIGFGRLRYNDDGITHRVIREEKLSVVTPHGHVLSRRKGPLKLKHTAGVPLILYPNAPRPSYADQVLSFYRNLGVEPNVAFEVRQLWTVLGLVAAGVGIALVPSSVRRLGREDVEYLILDEPEISSPIIMSSRTNDRSQLLAHILKLIDEFDQWTETDVSAPRRKGALR
jgi:LysR family transcriptional regulator, benzoate and cis,cis-muconate-responsive activator of ben and cat genes